MSINISKYTMFVNYIDIFTCEHIKSKVISVCILALNILTYTSQINEKYKIVHSYQKLNCSSGYFTILVQVYMINRKQTLQTNMRFIILVKLIPRIHCTDHKHWVVNINFPKSVIPYIHSCTLG